MDCTNCGAPLPAKSNICPYCKTVADTDLRTLRRRTTKRGESTRLCPRCQINLKLITINLSQPVEIDRCEECMGIFFDTGELEDLVDASVKQVGEVDYQRLTRFMQEERKVETQVVKYIKCPVCSELMHRKNYGWGSGVIIDTCAVHGIWLDGGELEQILKWTHAGGAVHAEKKARERKRFDEANRKARQNSHTPYQGPYGSGGNYDAYDLSENRSDVGYVLGAAIATAIRFLIR